MNKKDLFAAEIESRYRGYEFAYLLTQYLRDNSTRGCMDKFIFPFLQGLMNGSQEPYDTGDHYFGHICYRSDHIVFVEHEELNQKDRMYYYLRDENGELIIHNFYDMLDTSRMDEMTHKYFRISIPDLIEICKEWYAILDR